MPNHDNLMNHLAIIMDGNSRWAKDNNLSIIEGYKAGAEAVKKLIPAALEYKIPYITLYAFSSENRYRPPYEVSIIMDLLQNYLNNETKLLNKSEIRLKVIGRLDDLPSNIKKNITKAEEITKNNSTMTLCLAFYYGGRYEIIDACRKISEAGEKVSFVEQFKKYLYDPDMPDVDLLVRTGKVHRISNFLLWQSAYAELYFSSKYWPDFNKDDLAQALSDYRNRTRTFGI